MVIHECGLEVDRRKLRVAHVKMVIKGGSSEEFVVVDGCYMKLAVKVNH